MQALFYFPQIFFTIFILHFYLFFFLEKKFKCYYKPYFFLPILFSDYSKDLGNYWFLYFYSPYGFN